MRTKALLIISTYYITFIVIATLLSLFRGETNLGILNYMPVLFIVHGNITDVILYLILFSSSIFEILHYMWLWIYVPIDLIFNKYIIILHTFKPPIYLWSYINNIFHPPINIYFLY